VIAQQVAAIYAADTTLVASVTAIDQNSFWLWWKDDPVPEEVMVTDTTPADPDALARTQLETIKHDLSTGCLVIVSSTVTYTVPPTNRAQTAAVHEEIAKARTMSPEELDAGEWGGSYLPPGAARQFGVPLTLTKKRQ
jgi:hypothetical protein